MSPRMIVFGVAMGCVLAAANVYAGLRLGFIDVGTTTAILVAFGVFVGTRRPSADEVNVAQVIATSAGAMAVTAGVIGPVPALALGGRELSPFVLVIWSATFAVFGTLVALPFRRHLIEAKQLAFPSARAAGELIKSLFSDQREARRSVRLLAAAALGAAAWAVARDGMHWLPASVAVVGAIGFSLSPMLVGVGMLVGPRPAIGLALGMLGAWVVIAPLLVEAGIAKDNYGSVVSWTLWPGAALMVGSSLTSLLLGWRELARGFTNRLDTSDTSLRWAAPGFFVAGCVLVAIAWRGFDVHPVVALLGVVLAAVFSVSAMHATGETDNTPAGPLGGLTQVVVGVAAPGGIEAPLASGAAVNGAAVHASAMVSAWKTAEVIGARAPLRLVVAQLTGILGGAIASVVAYLLIREAYGIGTAALPAPGAISWKATADAVAGGTKTMPAYAPLAALIGAAVGVACALCERTRVRKLVPSATAIGVGFILPLPVTATIAVAALVFTALRVRNPVVASGLIVGEGVAGVAIAAVLVARML